ncbi:hypothetical protein P885DRAFT_12961, partial [Corynascus similis CBS 632.67]
RSERTGGKAEKLRVQATGPYPPDTLTSMANLALTYRIQGRLEEAEKLGLQAMETSKTKFGADHPITLRIISSLASANWNR